MLFELFGSVNTRHHGGKFGEFGETAGEIGMRIFRPCNARMATELELTKW